jgi:AraC-like DNA-binding protein
VDYRNRHRLNEAIRKIQNSEFKKKTLEGIGQESGFASRITFFNVFKKHTGMSATEYIEKLKRGEIQARLIDSPF